MFKVSFKWKHYYTKHKTFFMHFKMFSQTAYSLKTPNQM